MKGKRMILVAGLLVLTIFGLVAYLLLRKPSDEADWKLVTVYKDPLWDRAKKEVYNGWGK